MYKVTTADIQKLREMTDAGMMDCKKALEEAQGDYDAAQDWLRKKVSPKLPNGKTVMRTKGW